MTSRLFVMIGIVVAISFGGTAQESRAPRNAAEFDDLFKTVSNWGRWGKDDQLGSANLVTAQKRKHAVALVKTGTTVSLAHNPLTERAEDNSNPFDIGCCVTVAAKYRYGSRSGKNRLRKNRLRKMPLLSTPSLINSQSYHFPKGEAKPRREPEKRNRKRNFIHARSKTRWKRSRQKSPL